MKAVGAALRTGAKGLDTAYKRIHERAEKILSTKIDPSALQATLEAARNDAAAKVYDGTVAIATTLPADRAKLEPLREQVAVIASPEFVAGYAALGTSGAIERLANEKSFLALGLEFAKDADGICPFCEQAVGANLLAHVEVRHKSLETQLAAAKTGATRSDVRKKCAAAYEAAKQSLQIVEKRGKGLIDATNDSNSERVRDLFGKAGDANWKIAEAAGATARGAVEAAQHELEALQNTTNTCLAAIDAKKENVSEIESLAKTVGTFLTAVNACAKAFDDLTPALVAPDKSLRQAIDSLAGTTELALLIELLGKYDCSKLRKRYESRLVRLFLKSQRRSLNATAVHIA